MHRFRIAWVCFRYVRVPTTSVTLFTAYLLWLSGNPLFVVNLIWTKVITTGLLLLFVHFFLSGDFYFFNNLGFDKIRIYTSMVVPDFIIATAVYSIVVWSL
jgi:hypothetical protein